MENKNAMKCRTFNKEYLALTKKLIEEGKHESSRNGDTVEVLNFKTELTKPLERCVGGYGRNANIFFLLQEAIWIWLGQKHVEPLAAFNSNMRNFSDDGKTFHAPYGFRLRNYGIPSDVDTFEKICIDQDRLFPDLPNQGTDQIKECLLMLEANPQDRRVVASIWNPLLDLGTKCKDVPCNDMIMLKVRDEKLHMTIQNRSNDLHWGLPTNVFQFSFILEMMSTILGVEMGTQTHNSQSLHVYLNNPTTLKMLNKGVEGKTARILYEDGAEANEITFGKLVDLKEVKGVEERLKVVDNALLLTYRIVCELIEGIEKVSPAGLEVQLKELTEHSHHLVGIVKLLYAYLRYKAVEKKTDSDRLEALKYIMDIPVGNLDSDSDFRILAMNFFITRLKDKRSAEVTKAFENDFSNAHSLNLDY